jgi:hypothetical protein
MIRKYLKSVQHNTNRDFAKANKNLKKLLKVSIFIIGLDWFGMVPFLCSNPAFMDPPFWLYTLLKLGGFSLIFHIIGVAYFYIVLIRITFPNVQTEEASEATALLSALQSGCTSPSNDIRMLSDHYHSRDSTLEGRFSRDRLLDSDFDSPLGIGHFRSFGSRDFDTPMVSGPMLAGSFGSIA